MSSWCKWDVGERLNVSKLGQHWFPWHGYTFCSTGPLWMESMAQPDSTMGQWCGALVCSLLLARKAEQTVIWDTLTHMSHCDVFPLPRYNMCIITCIPDDICQVKAINRKDLDLDTSFKWYFTADCLLCHNFKWRHFIVLWFTIILK